MSGDALVRRCRETDALDKATVILWSVKLANTPACVTTVEGGQRIIIAKENQVSRLPPHANHLSGGGKVIILATNIHSYKEHRRNATVEGIAVNLIVPAFARTKIPREGELL